MNVADEIEDRAKHFYRPSVVLLPAAEFARLTDSPMKGPERVDGWRSQPLFHGVALRPSWTLAPNERVWCY